MSAAMCTGPTVLLRQLERGEHRPLRAADAEARRARRQRRARAASPLRRGASRLPASQRLGRLAARAAAGSAERTAPGPSASTSTLYSPAAGSMSLPCSGVWMSRRRSSVAISCSMYSGWPSSTTSTARLPTQKSRDLLGHQRVGDVEHQQRDVGRAEGIGQAELLQAADQRVVEPALHDDAEVGVRAREQLVELVLDDVAPRGRDALLALQLLVAEGDRRMREPHVVEAGRLLHQRARRDRRRARCPCTRSCRARGRRGCAAPSSPGMFEASDSAKAVLHHAHHHARGRAADRAGTCGDLSA